MPTARDTKPHEAPVLNPTEARQGRRGAGVIWVLLISLGLIVVIYAVMVGGVFGGRLARPGGQTQVGQNTGFNAPPSQPRQSENPQTTPTITPNPTNGRGQGQ